MSLRAAWRVQLLRRALRSANGAPGGLAIRCPMAAARARIGGPGSAGTAAKGRPDRGAGRAWSA